ncbi:MAG: LapA family protein [Candidatus Marinimicrobia bacterium]|nr:LapA family protein [Candidatus Neomarinimicrobiota bacterium]
MKLIKIFTGLIVVLLLLLFLIKNNDSANIDLVFRAYENINISIIMLGALTVGIVIGYGVAVASILTVRAENRILIQKFKQVTDELNDLRNVAIDEGIYDVESSED